MSAEATAVRQAVRDLQSAVRRGERFSRELERHGDMFPPIVSQLVIVGEQTGKLTGATSHICDICRAKSSGRPTFSWRRWNRP